MGARSSLPPPAEEPPHSTPTAASVAHEVFQKELEIHNSGIGVTEESQTVVILQDDCYGHRYSRPRTSRANLSTIVERPERIHASILGLATAYVRLGGRHAEGHAAPHPKRHLTSFPPPPFKLHKTTRRVSLRSPAATAIHGAKWMNELDVMCDAAESKLALTGKELTRPNVTEQTNGHVRIEKPTLHEGDLYLCSGSLNALEGALGGVCEGVDKVFSEHGAKRAFVCIRPPGHHCSADMPSGFCWLNNVHVGIGHAALTHGLTHAAIIDFDLHHGDGSQSITWAHNSRMASLPKNTPLSKKTAIGYFSLHDINSYPCEMGDEDKVRNASLCIENAHGQSMWNVHLQPWKTDAEFWQLYEDRYIVVLSKARSFLRLHSDRLRQAPTHPKPKAAIFLSAGFDASEWESPGMQRHQVNVPTDFYARFTRDMVTMSEEEGLGVDGRIISVLEGGYSDRALMSGVLSHISGLAAATGLSRQPNMSDGLGLEMGRRLGRLDINGDSALGQNHAQNAGIEAFDPKWWSLPYLEDIETLVNPPTTTVPSKRQRSDVRPTYSSATQSYTAKIVSPPQGRRSFSGSAANNHPATFSMNRAPSPPSPPVDWATAAYELSKLLVPSDRETRSCKPEDLNAEASRARRDRYSTVGLPAEAPATDPTRMQLRDRKGKPAQYASEDEEEKPVSRANRRKTISDVSLLAENNEPSVLSNQRHAGQPPRHSRRRSSVASSAGSTHAERGSDFSLSSATSAQSQRDPLVIKKSRAPAVPRQEATKLKATKKQPPVPRVPSAYTAKLIQGDGSAPLHSSHNTNTTPLSVNEDLRSKDVDQLASVMRTMSIKLNVPSKQEYEARESKPKAAPRGRPLKSTVPKPTKAVSPTRSKAKVVKDNPVPPSIPAQTIIVEQLSPPALASKPVQGAAETLPPQSELLQSAAQDSLEKKSASFAQPSSLPVPAYTSTATLDYESSSNSPLQAQQEEVKVQTPKAKPLPLFQQQSQAITQPQPATPITTKRARQDLPVFTSTSPISFGRSNAISSSIDQAMKPDNTTLPDQKLPGSPPSFPRLLDQPPVAHPAYGSGAMTTDDYPTLASPRRGGPRKEDLSSASIWDIPDTPQLRKL